MGMPCIVIMKSGAEQILVNHFFTGKSTLQLNIFVVLHHKLGFVCPFVWWKIQLFEGTQKIAII